MEEQTLALMTPPDMTQDFVKFIFVMDNFASVDDKKEWTDKYLEYSRTNEVNVTQFSFIAENSNQPVWEYIQRWKKLEVYTFLTPDENLDYPAFLKVFKNVNDKLFYNQKEYIDIINNFKYFSDKIKKELNMDKITIQFVNLQTNETFADVVDVL